MARPMRALDWLIVAALVIIAALVIYYLWPLAIAVAIIAAAYFIYKWYTGKSEIRIH
jgi:hypothetical protein